MEHHHHHSLNKRFTVKATLWKKVYILCKLRNKKFICNFAPC